jgi:hypothetical protein
MWCSRQLGVTKNQFSCPGFPVAPVEVEIKTAPNSNAYKAALTKSNFPGAANLPGQARSNQRKSTASPSERRIIASRRAEG